MSENPYLSPRLRALIGDAVLEMPPALIEKLEAIVAWQRTAYLRGEARADTLFDDIPMRSSVQIGRKLHCLGILLEFLHAAHLDQRDGSASPLLAEHVVEGLWVTCRDLAQSAALVLEAR